MKLLNLTPKQFEDVLEGKSELTLDRLIERSLMVSVTNAGESITPERALQAPTVFAIVNALSSIVGSLPFSVVSDDSAEGLRRHNSQPDHQVTHLLNVRPNRWQTRFEYWALVMVRLLLWGEFYALKNVAANKKIMSLQPIHPDNVEVTQDKRLRLQFKITDDAGGSRTVFQDQMHFIRSGVSLDGIRGQSPVSNIKESIAVEIASEKFGARTFGSGAIPNVVIQRKGIFKDNEARSKFKQSWDAMFSNKKRGTAVLEGDEWEITPIQMTNDESQYLQTRKLQRSIIAGAFRVPPHIVGDLERSTFSNINQQSLELLTLTLTPWLECCERAVERDLLTNAEVDSGVFAQFDTKRLMRGDPAAMADFIGKMRQWGIISANEARTMLDTDGRTDDAGDDYIVPLNFQSSDDTPAEDDAAPLRAVE